MTNGEPIVFAPVYNTFPQSCVIDQKLKNCAEASSILNPLSKFKNIGLFVALGQSNFDGLLDKILSKSSHEAEASSARSCNQACKSNTEYTVVPEACLISQFSATVKSEFIGMVYNNNKSYESNCCNATADTVCDAMVVTCVTHGM